ncbi:angiopoietin-related protein 6 [Microcaecilia unicolor]|uniref:Angiopoietin-related protein 6 n=1 Tax=Microcaecilia unicolor TaxID=1415580 RepID=A0A6P7XKE3_9AMPH|nr:angiopoietin-related protein 6 [Microcaecilia unicolor]
MMQVRGLLQALFLACVLLSEAQVEDPVAPSKCSYTFIVPQHKITGAICVSARYQDVPPAVNQSELWELRDELKRQHFQIGQLKRVVEADSAIVGEIKFLRKENRSMSTRMSQIYAQLLHEIILSKDGPAAISQLEGRVLNTTAEVLEIAAQYRDLQERYGQLASLINNQSVAIARLERECQRSANDRRVDQGPIEPPLVNVIPYDSGVGNANKTLSEVPRSQAVAGSSSSQDRKQRAQKEATISRASASTKGRNSSGPWRDCWDALQNGQAAASGLYLVRPDAGNQMMQVWCEQEREGGGWTVIQRRQDGSVNFFTTWEQYKQGFGNMDGEHWLGLENLYWLTSQDNYKLLVLLEDWKGRQVQAEYDYFTVGPESDFYRLRLGQYQGNAGDSLSWHADKQFSTLDNDRDAYSGNCAHYQKGGLWYNMCAHSNLNGVW